MDAAVCRSEIQQQLLDLTAAALVVLDIGERIVRATKIDALRDETPLRGAVIGPRDAPAPKMPIPARR